MDVINTGQNICISGRMELNIIVLPSGADVNVLSKLGHRTAQFPRVSQSSRNFPTISQVVIALSLFAASSAASRLSTPRPPAMSSCQKIALIRGSILGSSVILLLSPSGLEKLILYSYTKSKRYPRSKQRVLRNIFLNSRKLRQRGSGTQKGSAVKCGKLDMAICLDDKCAFIKGSF